MPSDKFFLLVPRNEERRCINKREVSGVVRSEDDVARIFHQDSITILAFLQRFFRPLALGDVVVKHLKVCGAVPNDFFTEDFDMTDLPVFRFNADFIIEWSTLASFSLFRSEMVLSQTLRGIVIRYRSCFQFITTVESEEI